MNPKITTGPITCNSGDAVAFDAYVVDAVTGAAIDITGMTVYFTAKQSLADSEVNAKVAVNSGGGSSPLLTFTITAATGHVNVVLHSIATASVPLGTQFIWQYDMKVQSGSDFYTFREDTWTINPSVTTTL